MTASAESLKHGSHPTHVGITTVHDIRVPTRLPKLILIPRCIVCGGNKKAMRGDIAQSRFHAQLEFSFNFGIARAGSRFQLHRGPVNRNNEQERAVRSAYSAIVVKRRTTMHLSNTKTAETMDDGVGDAYCITYQCDTRVNDGGTRTWGTQRREGRRDVLEGDVMPGNAMYLQRYEVQTGGSGGGSRGVKKNEPSGNGNGRGGNRDVAGRSFACPQHDGGKGEGNIHVHQMQFQVQNT
ncbi:hypothetical protein C8R44DRAFT_741045 [Mycena epipterygia]|nr:hypothetical protein C8R44DRAFT_741045 [Mycena epipterygia]